MQSLLLWQRLLRDCACDRARSLLPRPDTSFRVSSLFTSEVRTSRALRISDCGFRIEPQTDSQPPLPLLSMRIRRGQGIRNPRVAIRIIQPPAPSVGPYLLWCELPPQDLWY